LRQRDILQHREVREQVKLLEHHPDFSTKGAEDADVVA
jgi:hypothetical protein